MEYVTLLFFAVQIYFFIANIIYAQANNNYLCTVGKFIGHVISDAIIQQ